MQRVSFHLQKDQKEANLKLNAIKLQRKLRVKKYTYKIQNSNFLSGAMKRNGIGKVIQMASKVQTG